MWRSAERYHGGGRGGYTSSGGSSPRGTNREGDRYQGGSRGGYTTGGTPRPEKGAATKDEPLQEDWRRRR